MKPIYLVSGRGVAASTIRQVRTILGTGRSLLSLVRANRDMPHGRIPALILQLRLAAPITGPSQVCSASVSRDSQVLVVVRHSSGRCQLLASLEAWLKEVGSIASRPPLRRAGKIYYLLCLPHFRRSSLHSMWQGYHQLVSLHVIIGMEVSDDCRCL